MNSLLKTILFLSVTAHVIYSAQGFFVEDWAIRHAPKIENAEDSASFNAEPSTVITLDASKISQKILPNYFGNNINPWLGKALLDDSDYGIKHLKNAGVSYLRLPGGNWTNKMLWDETIHWNFLENYEEEIKGQPKQTWTITPNEMLSLSTEIGAKPQICVNLSLARYIPGPDSIEQAAHYAANWVRHVNSSTNTYTKYWEIGNENYGSWQAGYIVNGDTIDGTYYGKAFQIFADSMKAADPTIKIGAVVVEQDNGNIGYGGHNFWMKKMLPLISNKADFLAYHEYFTWNENLNDIPTLEGLASLSAIKNAKDSIETFVERYTGKPKNHFPIAVTEYNTRMGDKTNSAFGGLFVAMAIPEFIRHEYGLINLWAIVDGYHEGEGDFGMLSEKADNVEAPYYTPRPSFYPYFLFNKMWGDLAIESPITDFTNLYIAASIFSETGELVVLMVNPTQEKQNIQLKLENYNAKDSVLGYTVSAEKETSKNIYLNGRTGIYGPTDYENIPPWKRKIQDAIFEIPPWSYHFILFTPQETFSNIFHKEISPTIKNGKKYNRDASGKQNTKKRTHKVIY